MMKIYICVGYYVDLFDIKVFLVYSSVYICNCMSGDDDSWYSLTTLWYIYLLDFVFQHMYVAWHFLANINFFSEYLELYGSTPFLGEVPIVYLQ